MLVAESSEGGVSKGGGRSSFSGLVGVGGLRSGLVWSRWTITSPVVVGRREDVASNSNSSGGS